MRRRMMEENHTIFRSALSVLHFDANYGTDAKGNLIVWDSNYSPMFISPGKFGNALAYGRCRVNLPVSTIDLKAFTISCWVKAYNKKVDDCCTVCVNPDNQASMVSLIGFNIGYLSPGSVRLLIGNGSTGWADTTTSLGDIPLDSAWHHFEISFNNGVIVSFVDGVKYGTITKRLPTMTDYRRIGVMAGNISYIDEVIYTPHILHTENFTPLSKPYR